MAIRCPYCQHVIELAGVKPGHFHPRCPNCQGKFDLLIPNDTREPPRVLAMAEGAPGGGGGAKPQAAGTGAPKSVRVPVAETVAPVAHAPRPNVAAATRAPVAATSAAPAEVDRDQFFTIVKHDLAYDDLHGRLGGYELVQKLGQGGMGSVYLARQLSLDRNVAVKTLSPTLAADPQFVARFTREAYAAAQLNHHNVVQIHDIDQDKGTNFFSMELVDGTNLAQVVEREGRLDPITAVTYVLQAARGLKFAHDHGLIHRDVKPENLLLNNEGVVKVADLGLVKRTGVADPQRAGAPPGGPSSAGAAGAGAAGTTQLNTSMGTPAYMAPEQVRDAGKVDQRADIYSLGCTLYDLITGRPPFSGKSAIEVMTKHQKEPIVPPEKIVANLPRRLSEIVQRMTAKAPDARYQSMAQVVKELEDFLGVEHGGGVRAGQDQIAVVGSAVERFNAASFANLRANAILAFFLLGAITLFIGALTLNPRLVGGTVAFVLLATLAYQLTLGVTQRTVIFSKVRQFLLGASVADWAMWIVALVIGTAILYLLGQLGMWAAVAAAAVVVGVAFHFFVDHVVAVQREEPLREVERMIRDMRLKGIDEDGIRGFVAKFSGHNWEAFYEALFGYESKIQARRLYGKGERGRDRRRYAVWRDWIIAMIDRRLEQRKLDRERRLLAKLERRALESKGLETDAAATQAGLAASAMVAGAKQLKDRSSDRRLADTLAPAAGAKATTVRPDWIDSEAPHVSESLEGWERHGYLRRRYGGPLDILLGRRVRFLLAAAVLLGAARWGQINGLPRMLDEFRNFGEDIQRTKAALQAKTEGALTTGAKQTPTAPPAGAKPTPGTPTPTPPAPTTPTAPPAAPTAAAVPVADEPPARATDPLRVPMVPQWTANAIGSWNGLLAGVLLLLSVVIYGHKMSVGVLLGAAIILFGNLYPLPIIGTPAALLTALVGGVIALFSMLFLRETVE